MRPLRQLAPWLCLLSLILFAGCRKPTPRAASELDIFFTCDTHGRLVPCGCFTGQHGGLTRLKTELEREGSTNSIRVDVGDAPGGKEDYHLIEYKYLLKAYQSMGFDALNLGSREAQLSAVQLRELEQKSKAPFVSANVLEKTNGAPLFERFRIVEREGWKIAIVGVVDPLAVGEEIGAGLEVEKMESVLGRLLPELRPKVDLIVLLAFTDEATLTRLAEEFYELDVILGGKVRQPSQHLQKTNRSLVFFTTNESRTLGILRVRLQEKAKVIAKKDEIRLLVDKIPEDSSIAKLAQEYREEIRSTRLAVDDPGQLQENMVPGVRQSAGYAGSETCLKCHAGSAHVWKESSHADAFRTLVRKKADADPKCIGCHTIGFGLPSGYRREFKGARLAGVGCESCHGPGSLHVSQHEAKAAITFKFRPLGAGDCQKCHYGEFSRPFDWKKFWPPIKHGLDGKQERTAQL